MILGTRDVVGVIGKVGFSGIHDPWLDKQIEKIDDFNFWDDDDEDQPFWMDTKDELQLEPSEVDEPEVPTGAERAAVQHGVKERPLPTGAQRAYEQHGVLPKFNSGRWEKDYDNGRIPLAAMEKVAEGHYLRPDAAASWKRMARAARKDGVTLSFTDTYRSYEAQERVAQEKGLYKNGGLAAVPGTSDHGWGIAVDAGEGHQRAWIAKNGRRFGWVMDTPGEPWHFGYKGSKEKVNANRNRPTRRSAPQLHRIRRGREGSVQAIGDVGFAPEFSAVTALPGAVLSALNSPPPSVLQPGQRPRKGKGGGGGGPLPNWVPARLRDDIARAARATGVPAGLIAAVAKKESGFRRGVQSSAGAIGEMQLMPGTAASLNVDPYKSAQNIMGGARYLAQMIKLAKGNYRLALAMYNAGPNQSRSFLQSRFSVYSDPVLDLWRGGR